MKTTSYQQAEHEAQRMEANREELAERIARAVPEDGSVQPLEEFYLARHSLPVERIYSVGKPSFCVIAQGSKEILLGNSHYRYDPLHYLIATVELPRISQILEASPERPYLSLLLELSPALVGSVMVEAGHVSSPVHADVRAMDVSRLTISLQDAVVRLVRLLDTPGEAPVLMPLITREIVYRLLMGQQGARLQHLMAVDGYTPLISKAIERLHQDYDQPLRIEQLARELGMSVSSFAHHFKAVTAMSPLQFQKRLRLQEARRLMLGEDLDAAGAGYRVGYHDASHFSREYRAFLESRRCATCNGCGKGRVRITWSMPPQ